MCRIVVKHVVQKHLLPSSTFVEAQTAEEALERLTQTDSIDIAILDENYGVAWGLTGMEIARQVRQRERARAEQQPMVLVGYSGSKQEEAAIRASGLNFVWGKPLPNVQRMREQLFEALHARRSWTPR